MQRGEIAFMRTQWVLLAVLLAFPISILVAASFAVGSSVIVWIMRGLAIIPAIAMTFALFMLLTSFLIRPSD